MRLCPSEKEIQAAIIQALSLHGYKTIVTDAGGAAAYRKAARQGLSLAHGGASALPRGFPDLLALGSGGRAIFVEVKVSGKKPRADQALWLSWLQVHGFKAFWADSVDSCLSQLGAP